MVEILGRFSRTAAAFNMEVPPCHSSSGSDHSPEETTDLWDLVESFIDSEGKVLQEELLDEDKSDLDDDDYEDVKERVRVLVGIRGGEDRRRIMDEVSKASVLSGEKRHLMVFLRNKGLDAGLCKSRWEKFGKNTAGTYEYVDIKGSDNNRFIVETNLAGEFEIARPTTRYLSLLGQIPQIFVGTPEELKKLVRIMCFEIRRSMKRAEIHVPPWRRNGYMQAKWFGHYKRTSNEVMTRAKSCGCAPHVGFDELVRTTTFSGLKEGVERKRSGLMVGRLTVAFNSSGVVL